MSDDTLSNKQMDEAVERAYAIEQHAIKNSSNNTPEYVAQRLAELHGSGERWVPVREGSSAAIPAHLVVPDLRGRELKCAARPNGGIIVKLQKFMGDDVAEYVVEINGRNGVEVTGLASQ